MTQSYNNLFKTREQILHPGDYYSSKETIVISTILGSCISVVLIDEVQNCCGMNHFMLPHNQSTVQQDDIFYTRKGRYGVQAMELLINSMMKKGSRKKNLQAKVFGGGEMFEHDWGESIGAQNIRFAFEFLKKEGIPVIASSTGQSYGRRILLLNPSGKVFQKRIESQNIIKQIHDKEETLLKKLDSASESNIILFK